MKKNPNSFEEKASGTSSNDTVKKDVLKLLELTLNYNRIDVANEQIFVYDKVDEIKIPRTVGIQIPKLYKSWLRCITNEKKELC